MSCGNIPPNTEATISEDSSSPRDIFRSSSPKEPSTELDNASIHEFLRTQVDTDSVHVLEAPDGDYRHATGVANRDCGEPMKSQSLRIDFNPIKGVDDDAFVQNKCVEFWKFIDDHPELDSLKARAKKESVMEDSYSSISETISSTSSESSEGIGLTPITMMTLDWLKNGELMTHALATQPATRACELVQNYDKYSQKNKSDEWPTAKKQDVAKVHRVPFVTSRTSAKSRGHLNSARQDSSLTLLMAEMNHWDSEHPKSMAPPIHPAGICRPIKKVECKESILPYIGTNKEKYCEKCLN